MNQTRAYLYFLPHTWGRWGLPSEICKPGRELSHFTESGSHVGHRNASRSLHVLGASAGVATDVDFPVDGCRSVQRVRLNAPTHLEGGPMADVEFSHHSPCPPQRIRQLLLNEAFLEEFVHRQNPQESAIHVDQDAKISISRWVNVFGDDVHGIVKALVGNRADIELTVDANVPGRLDVRAKASRTGTMSAALEIVSEKSGSWVSIVGSMHVSGFLGEVAAGQARDLVIKPILTEDLFPLLDEWCDGQRSTISDSPGS